MKLSAIIADYRDRMQISQREFARRCDLSNSYISFLEKETNPKTGRPMVPTLIQYKKIATGMNMTVQQLFEMLDDDAPVDMNSPGDVLRSPVSSFGYLSEDEQALLSAFRVADDRARTKRVTSEHAGDGLPAGHLTG